MKAVEGQFKVIRVDPYRRTVDTHRIPSDGNVYTFSCPPGPLPEKDDILTLAPKATVH
jgi:hypothetical protein